jgi:glycosyltransferase involved in cell wall biosynthesis
VFASRCLEGGYALSYVEALAAGLPVVAVQGSSVAEHVAAAGTGLTVSADADTGGWAQVLSTATARRGQFAAAARAAYEQSFTPASWLSAITGVYAAAGVALAGAR